MSLGRATSGRLFAKRAAELDVNTRNNLRCRPASRATTANGSPCAMRKMIDEVASGLDVFLEHVQRRTAAVGRTPFGESVS